jgi:hypothetical protein
MAIISENKKDLVALSKKLKSVKLVGSGISKQELRSWQDVYLLLIGSFYSLDRALPLLHKSLNFDELYSQARFLLDRTSKGKRIREKKHSKWFDGYYLNSAELRITSALHRLLGIYYNQKGPVFELIKLKTLPSVTTRKNPSYIYILMTFAWENKKHTELHKVIEETIKNKHLPNKSYQNNEGLKLWTVWDRVNKVKHVPVQIEPDRYERWREAYLALNALLKVYIGFANRKNINE